MSTKVVSFNQTETPSLQSEKTSDALRQRLTAAEDTHQLVKQLEDMGFSVKLRGEPTIADQIHTTGGRDMYIADQGTRSTSYGIKGNSQQSYNQEHLKDSYLQGQQNLPSSFDTCKSQSNESFKNRVIPPFSTGSITVPSLFSRQETKVSNKYAPKLPSSFENGSKRQTRSEILETKPSHRDMDQELVRMKQMISQLEEDVQTEMEDKNKAKEETEKLRSSLDDIAAARAELEMKVDELTLAKQKLMKKVSELKEEAIRESSLRSSLEESHTTLFSRLQDMESVVESLRDECTTHTANSNSLKAEVIKFKDELTQETIRRQRIEDNYHILVTEKDKLLVNAKNSQSENQHVYMELTCLQTQYTDLVNQTDQMKVLVDSLTTSKKIIEEERTDLQTNFQTLTSDHEKLKMLYEKTKKSESNLVAEKSVRDEEFLKQKTEIEKLLKDNFVKKQKYGLEQELEAIKQNLTQKNQEFASAADDFELELAGIKNQLEAMENEKQKVLKDKGNLLEEVNQTVDTLMSERSRLQTELQASCVETESLRLTCSRLELDKTQLLEKLEGLQQQQTSTRKVETVLNEMMAQKNKLAYENGKLHSTIDQLEQELADVTKEQSNVMQLRKLSESLQVKYTKSQQELSEYKIALQRLEAQSRLVMEELEQKDHQLKMAQTRRSDAEKEMEKLLSQLEVQKGRYLHKIARYEKNMDEAKNVNKEITGTLEAVMTSHTQLQNVVENLQVELGKRDSQIGQLKNIRNKELEDTRHEIKNHEEKMEKLRQELKKQQEKAGKRTVKEHSEISKQNENLSSRNQDLMKANSDLRQKMVDMEKEKNEMKRNMSGQRHKLQYLHKTKKQLEENLNKMKAVHEDIEELERMREEYIQKNKEQGETIGNFVQLVTSLQDEVRQLASAHYKTQHLLRLKEEALEKERRIHEEIRERYTECKKREEELSKKSQSSNEKLKEVHSESLEISKHLEEAHDWFKGTFDKLQTELTASRQIHTKLEMGNVDQRKSLEQEKSRTQDAAERAKEMIQNSQQTISQLADYAKMREVQTKKHSQANLHTASCHPD